MDGDDDDDDDDDEMMMMMVVVIVVVGLVLISVTPVLSIFLSQLIRVTCSCSMSMIVSN